MAGLTGVTIAKNEEGHITRALRSLKDLADELLVVDAESTDRTVEVARRFTENIFRRPWAGYGPQKNFALERATGDWVLFIDADEEVTKELSAEIRRVLASVPGTVRVVFVKIVTEFLGQPLNHLWGTNPRLLRRSAVTWENRAVHERVVRPDGSVVRLGDADTLLLTEVLRHPSHYRTLAAYLEKRERYTSQDAEELLKTGRDRLGKPIGNPSGSPLATARFLYERAGRQFVRLTINKRGFLDGWKGVLWVLLSAQYEYLVSKKYLALRRERGEGET